MHADSDRRHRGVSLIEALIAMLIILVIATGVVALMTRAMAANLEGHQSTDVANLAKSRVEEYLELNFNDPRLTLVTGTELQVIDYVGAHERTTTVRQYTINNNPLDPGPPIGPLDAGISPTLVHLKEIEVEVEHSMDNNPLGQGESITVRAYKSQ